MLLEEELLRPRRLFLAFSLRRSFFSFFNFFFSFSIFFLSFLALFFSAPLRFRLAMATAAGPEAPKGFLKNNLEEKHCHKTAAPQVAARVSLLHSSRVSITAARDRLQRLHEMLKSQLCKSFLDSGEPFAGPPKASPFQVPPGCTISRSPKSTTSRLAILTDVPTQAQACDTAAAAAMSCNMLSSTMSQAADTSPPRTIHAASLKIEILT